METQSIVTSGPISGDERLVDLDTPSETTQTKGAMYNRQKSGGVTEIEWLWQVQQQAKSLRHGVIRLVIRSAKIVWIEPTEQGLFAHGSPSAVQRASVESFITDWADS